VLLNIIIIIIGPVWAETRAQSVDLYSSGTLHPGQVLKNTPTFFDLNRSPSGRSSVPR